MGSRLPASLAWTLCTAVALLSSSSRADDRITATVSIALDAPSQGMAITAAKVARVTFAETGDRDVVDLEQVLEGGQPPPWRARLEQGNKAKKKADVALDALELPIAADAYAEALVAYEQATPGLRDLTPVLEVLGGQGVVFALQGDKAAARRSFERLIALDPATSKPMEPTPARAQKLFDDVLKDMRRLPEAGLTVYATSGAAEVWVDAIYRGNAPLSLELPVGRHFVRVVRDGYKAWGQVVEVKRGTDATAQAELVPTEGFPRFDELCGRVARNKDAAAPIAELARFLKVDELAVLLVEDDGGATLVSGLVVEGVSGKVKARASRAFTPSAPSLERELKNFVADALRDGRTVSAPLKEQVKDGPDGSLLLGDAENVDTPGLVIGGWVVTGLGGAVVVGGIASGIYALYTMDFFRNKLSSQRDPQLEGVRSAWLASSIGADLGVAVGLAAIGAGVVMLVFGYEEQAAREELLKK